jgi:pyrroline-5-carboxylate reductase
MTTGAAPRIGFLGAGKMATALARAWIAGLVPPSNVCASDPVAPARKAFTAETGLDCTEDNLAVVNGSDVLVLAVKPQSMTALLKEIAPAVSSRHLLVSIAAGLPLRVLLDGLGGERRLVRVMPNTPCLVGASAAGFCPGATATADDVALVDRLFNAVGRAFRLPEHLLDAVTGLSGSGPAFV